MQRSHVWLATAILVVGSVLVSCASSTTTASSSSSTKSAHHSPYDKPGYVTDVEDGRLWVFRKGSKELAEYQKYGEPAKSVTLIGAGRRGMTVRGPDRDTINSYLVSKPGFFTEVAEGRIWVFRPGTKDLAEYKRVGEPAKSVTLIGAGPRGMTVRGPDRDTINEYLVAKPGFYTKIVDGRLWIFRNDSKDLEEFKKTGEPAKSITRVGSGPRGLTVRGPDAETLDAYAMAH